MVKAAAIVLVDLWLPSSPPGSTLAECLSADVTRRTGIADIHRYTLRR
jgi:hypothetical protein